MDSLDKHPQIAELMDTLEENHMHKEREEVQSLVDYIGDMETTLSEMLKEMQGMRHEINLIHNNSLKAKCQNLVQRTEDKVKQAASVVTRVKNNLIQSAGNAVKAYKEKGREAFRKAVKAMKQAVKAMKLPETLDRLAGFFYKLSKETDQSISQLNEMQSELNSAKGHFKNVGRLLIGRTTTEAEHVKSDKGVLSRFGKLLSKMSAGFDRLSQKAMDASDKIRVSHVKESVRTELDSLKSIDKGRSRSDPLRER